MSVNIITDNQIKELAEAAVAKAFERVNTKDRWMRVNTVADYADVHRTTVLGWNLPSSLVGGVRLYKKSDVDEFLMSHRIKRKLQKIA